MVCEEVLLCSWSWMLLHIPQWQQRIFQPQMSTVLRLRNTAAEYCGSKHNALSRKHGYLSGSMFLNFEDTSSKLKEGERIRKITLTSLDIWCLTANQLPWALLSGPHACLEAAIDPVRGSVSQMEEGSPRYMIHFENGHLANALFSSSQPLFLL